MNRVKFKVWDDNSRRFLGFHDFGYYIKLKDYELVPAQEGIKIVFYTESKDINGKEIYDRDFIQFRIDNYLYTYVVIWMDGAWYLLTEKGTDDSPVTLMWPLIRSVEEEAGMWGQVIGNEFEHPNLKILLDHPVEFCSKKEKESHGNANPTGNGSSSKRGRNSTSK
jgi:hypothetical protein